MRLRDLLNEIEVIESCADPDMEISDICYDSRKAQKGSLFVAVEGMETDGHIFISKAIENGASAVICQKKVGTGFPYIMTSDSRKALALASAAFFDKPAEKLKMIGVTGTNGKTTTTTLIKNMLEACTGKKAGLIGTNQNMIGDRVIPAEHTTPESRDLQELLAQMVSEGCEYAVMEVSSHSLVLSRVEDITYEAGVFTNLTQDHLDFHKDMNSYLMAKARLFEISRHGVINLDDSYAESLLKNAKCPVMTYGIDRTDSILRALNIKLESDCVVFDAEVKEHSVNDYSTASIVPMKLSIPGRFSVYNALAAIGCCLSLGIELTTISAAIAMCRGVKGRAEVVPTPGKDFTILIDYAHTPDAMENILRTVRDFAKGRVVIVFGCGGDRDSSKRPKMGKISSELADFVIVTSDNPRTEEPGEIIEDIMAGLAGTDTPYVMIEDRREAIRWAIENAKKDDIIILAGKGHETYQILGKTKHHMDEREIVSEILGK